MNLKMHGIIILYQQKEMSHLYKCLLCVLTIFHPRKILTKKYTE